jgi:hypothetical protein
MPFQLRDAREDDIPAIARPHVETVNETTTLSLSTRQRRCPWIGGELNKIYVLQRRTDRRASSHKVKNPRGRLPIIVTPRHSRQVNGSGYGMNHAQRNVPSLPAGAPANSSIAAARNQITMSGAAHPIAMLIASRPLRLPSDCQRPVPERILRTRTAQPRRVRDLNTARRRQPLSCRTRPPCGSRRAPLEHRRLLCRDAHLQGIPQGARARRGHRRQLGGRDDSGRLLGIGLSEDTAIVVKGDQFEVMGKSKVAIHDNTRKYPPWKKPYSLLGAGDTYNMRTRKVFKYADVRHRPLTSEVER